MTRRPAPPSGAVGEVARLFLRLGATAFGGPAAHIALMHDEVVVRRGWMSNQHFLDLTGATNLIPGPNSTELAIHIGHERAGWRGLLTAGTCFIAPAFVIVLAMAWAYVEYGSTPAVEGVLYGVQPVVIVIVLQALLKLARTALAGPLLCVVAAAALAAYLLGVFEIVILVMAGLVVVAIRAARRGHGLGAFAGLVAGAPAGWPAHASAGDLTTLFLTFLKIGAVLYGSGYVLLAFLRQDFVERLAWLTEEQLLDAVAIGQVTPGPVFTTATFVGYVTSGPVGAVLATLAIFLPSFVFVALLGRIVPWIRRHRWTADALDGVNAGALALMAGVTWQLGRVALVDWVTVLVAVVAGIVLWRTRLNPTWVIAGGAGVGVLREVLVA